MAAPESSPDPSLLRVTTPRGEGRALLVEAPLILEVAGERLVTMRTPGAPERDIELARGFLVSERIVPGPAAILSVEPFTEEGIDGLRIALPEGSRARRGRLTRVHEIRASCGLCGIPSVENLAADLPELPYGAPALSLVDAASAPTRMRPHQRLFAATGAAHAAALFSGDARGEPLLIREDVGRHNAVDRVIGAALARELELASCALVLSGRGGFELILKALRLGIPTIISVSAPSSLAVALAEEAGATLIGFARGDAATLYCDAGRVSG